MGKSTQEARQVEKTYDEHIDFSITDFYSLYQASAGHDIEADPYIQWVEDKFNVTIDQWACDANNAKETVRLWVNGGTMPDSMIWPDLSVSEIIEYADQGQIQGLPEGWEEKWPNLDKMIKDSGYGELVKVDGVTYAIPHATFGNFNSMETAVGHDSVYFRKDWAKQIGMPNLGENYTIKLSELKEYLQKVREAGLCDNPTVGAAVTAMPKMFRLANGTSSEDFIKTDKGYVWGPSQDGYTTYIKQMEEWYKEGLLDPDFYVKETMTTYSEFQEGYLAAMFYSGGVGNYQGLIDNLMDLDGKNKIDDAAREPYRNRFGLATIIAEDGSVYADGRYNYWMMNTFSPDCDKKKMERILDIVDWFCTKEGQVSERLAIPGQDFSIDETGTITILNQAIVSGEYLVCPSRYFNVWGYCGDDLAYADGIPGRFKAEQDLVLANYAVKLDGTIFKKDDKVEALSSDAKKEYSVDTTASIAEIVVAGKDVDTEWKKFIDNNKVMWQPVLDDLNK